MKSSESKKRNRTGVILIVWPWATLMLLILTSSAVSALIGTNVTSDSTLMIARVVNMATGYFGVISILGIFVSTPFGVYLLSTESKKK
jgi:hypothetical protein